MICEPMRDLPGCNPLLGAYWTPRCLIEVRGTPAILVQINGVMVPHSQSLPMQLAPGETTRAQG